MIAKIFTEIVLDVFQELSYLLMTRLPYPWDFCRIKLEPTTRLLLNSGSYYVVYAAFMVWFVKYVLKVITAIAGSRLNRKDYAFVAIISASMASQVLWPLLLMSTYFITCSYYPWISTLSVVYLHIPLAIRSLISLGITRSAEYLLDMRFSWSLDAVNFNTLNIGEDSIYSYNFRQSSPEVNISDEILPFSSHAPLSVDSLKYHRIPYSTSRTRQDISQARSGERDVVELSEADYRSLRSGDGKPVIERVSGTSSADNNQVIAQEINKAYENTRTRNEAWDFGTRTVTRSTGIIPDKRGYCGRCWRGNYLSFQPGFSELRKPYTTRLGTVYGPTHRFLNITEYLKMYGL